jgi:ornithine cyclodeaminase
MRIISAADIADVLTFAELIETLRSAFRTGAATPVRHHHAVALPDQCDATLLLMPSWTDFAAQGHSDRGYIGVKIVSVFPDNASRDRATVSGVYLLMSGRSGEPLALIDGKSLTLWRTAAASALAASYLARQDRREPCRTHGRSKIQHCRHGGSGKRRARRRYRLLRDFVTRAACPW